MKKIQKTKDFFIPNNNLIIRTADKGHITVILDKIEYNRKINDLLCDISTYIPLKSDLTTNIQAAFLLMDFMLKKYFNKTTYRFLNCTNIQVPDFYGLSKIHKPGTPLRPVTTFYSNPIGLL